MSAGNRFSAIAQRTKTSIGRQQISNRVLALILGYSPEAFEILRAQDAFPVEALSNFARSFPKLRLNVSWITEEGGNPYEQPPSEQVPTLTPEAKGRAEMVHRRANGATATEPAEPFNLPTLEEMSAYIDAEMARMGIAQQGAAA